MVFRQVDSQTNPHYWPQIHTTKVWPQDDNIIIKVSMLLNLRRYNVQHRPHNLQDCAPCPRAHPSLPAYLASLRPARIFASISTQADAMSTSAAVRDVDGGCCLGIPFTIVINSKTVSLFSSLSCLGH
jgi:hypothetical protein